MVILHLSHSDIASDARILKEMTSLTKLAPGQKIYGIGIKDINSRTAAVNPALEIVSIWPFFKRLTFLRHLRYLLIYLEVALKMLAGALRIKPDVIHCHDVPMLPVAVLAKILTGAKLVYDAHELESQQTGSSKFGSKAVLFVEKMAWMFVDAFITVSGSIETWYLQKLGRKKAAVILNAPSVSTTDLQTTSGYLREHFNIASDKKIFLYNGLLTAGRGLDLLTDIFQRDDIESHLVFLGYGELIGDLIELSKKCPRIHVHQAVPYNKVIEISSGADYGVCLVQNFCLSNYYCLPNKLFEYSFAGIRVLASNFPEISTVVKKYNLGECVDLNQDEILRAIKKLEIEKIGPKSVSQDLVREMSWAAQEAKLLSLYQGL